MSETPAVRFPRETTRDVHPGAPDAAAEAERAKHGFPWCDTCQRPSVASEFFGLMHSTPEHRFGVPRHLDPHDHEVTHRQWFATPTCRDIRTCGCVWLGPDLALICAEHHQRDVRDAERYADMCGNCGGAGETVFRNGLSEPDTFAQCQKCMGTGSHNYRQGWDAAMASQRATRESS